MAIIVHTSNPGKLLTDIKKAIDDKVIDTWSYDKDGDFTHTPDQWKNKAWLKPEISSTLNFKVIGQKDVKMEDAVYGVYDGRFAEMLLTHFKVRLTSVSVS